MVSSGWVPNTSLIDLDPATVLDVKLDKMRKTLQAAHQLAAENHPLSYYKEVLQNYQEELIEQEKAKAAKAATPKGKKSKAASEDDEDVEMEDAPDAAQTPAKDKKAKKRKADDSAEVSLLKRRREQFMLTVADSTAFRFGQEAQDQAHHQCHTQGSKRDSSHTEVDEGC